MQAKVMHKMRRCTYCNSQNIHINASNELGIMRCLCQSCGNTWGQ